MRLPVRFLYLLSMPILLHSPPSLCSEMPRHERLIYENPLTADGEDDFVRMSSINGTYSAAGWTARVGGRLVLYLNNRLPATGSIEFQVTQFDPRVQATKGKQPIFVFTSRPYSDLSIYDEGVKTAFLYLRTGTNYFTGTDRCGLEFDTGYEGLRSRDSERGDFFNDKKWYPDLTYRFKFVWDHDHMWLLLNDEPIRKQAFKTPVERIQYISVGGDELYATIVGPVYSNLRIYAADTDVIYRDQTFVSNLTGDTSDFSGHGIAVADVNGDGWDDLFVAGYQKDGCSSDRLYIRQSNGDFVEQAEMAGILRDCGSFSAVFFDLDNDDDPDLLTPVFGGRDRLYVNDGTGNFTEQGNERGLSASASLSGGAVAFDANGDGVIDIFVTRIDAPNELYLNNGSGNFVLTVCGAEGLDNNSGLEDPSQVTVVDVDEDGDLDLYITKRRAANELYLNTGNGTFVESATPAGIALQDPTLFSSVFADYDNDGDMDLFCAVGFNSFNSDPLLLRVFDNDGSGTFSERTHHLQLPMHGRSLHLLDADNDGYLDIYVLGNSEFDKYYENRLWSFFRSSYASLFMGSQSGTFSDAGAFGADISAYGARAVTAADFDRDGDLDLFLTCDGFENVYFENTSPANNNNWIQINSKGASGDWAGLGTKVKIYAAGNLGDPAFLLGYQLVTSQSGYSSGNASRLHFGLGNHTTCDVRLEYPDGTIQEIRNLQANSHHELLPSDSILLLEAVGGDNQTGFVGQRLDQPFAVQVTDGDTQPVAEVAVEWSIVQGNGQVEGATSTLTDLSGSAFIYYRFGAEPESAIVEARVAGALGSPVRFTAVSVYPPVSLAKISGDGQSGTAGTILAAPIVVRTLYPDGTPAANTDVTFRILSGGGNLAGSDSAHVQSDAQGLAQVAWTLGTRSGWQSLEAQAGTSTCEFNAEAMPDTPHRLTAKSGQLTSYEPGREFAEPFAARLADRHDNPIPGYPLLFSVEGGGNLRGQTTRTFHTDSLGRAQVYWMTGPYRGPEQMLTVAVTDPAYDLSLRWRVPGIAVSAENSTLTAETPIAADGTSRSEITVTLRDENGQALGAGLTVHLLASGAGNIVTTPDTLTDSGGEVRSYLSTTVAERKTIRARVAGLNLMLVDSAHIDAVINPDLDRSTLGATSPVWADGVHRSEITAQIVDRNGNPLPGIAVEFTADGNGNTLVQPTATDDQGYAVGYLQSNVAEEKTIRAWILPERLVLPAQARVRFVEPETALEIVSGDSQEETVGNRLSLPLVVRLHVGGQPLAGVGVQFAFESSGGNFDGNPLLQTATDSNGRAFARPTLGTRPGVFLVKAWSEDAPAVWFTLTAKIGKTDTLVILAGNNQLGRSNQPLNEPFRVRALDQFANPVIGIAIHFQALDGGTILSPNPVATDSSGMAECLAALGNEEKTHRFRAWVTDGPQALFAAEPEIGNHPPQILHYVPATDSIAAHYGDVLDFDILHVQDVDGDSIYFLWMMYGMQVAHDRWFRIVANPSLPSPFFVNCLIHDKKDTTRLQWKVSLKSQTTTAEQVDLEWSRGHFEGVDLTFHISPASAYRSAFVQRSEGNESAYRRIHSEPIAVMNGTVRYRDTDLATAASNYYRLELIDANGAVAFSSGFEMQSAQPQEIELLQNYPNPFNPSTTIRFVLNKALPVQVVITDLSGRSIRTLLAKTLGAGHHQLVWDGKNDRGETVASGVYICRLQAGTGVWSRKMMFIK
ncbi:Ig-like domain-containing protein [candidate division KSB1 bacterium]|nr:Ig-like domain-containing protein [candidate division KSB1 bacterium]